jgi:hypothetical protein
VQLGCKIGRTHEAAEQSKSHRQSLCFRAIPFKGTKKKKNEEQKRKAKHSNSHSRKEVGHLCPRLRASNKPNRLKGAVAVSSQVEGRKTGKNMEVLGDD